jgi:hypothetical protein
VADFWHEIAAADIRDREEADWLRALPAESAREDGGLRVPGLERLAARLDADLAAMARPLLDAAGAQADVDPVLATRTAHWHARLQALHSDTLDDALLAALTRGRRDEGDSLHLLVMDLHTALNRLAEGIAGEDIAGAHAWNLAADSGDRARVETFMRGVERTRALKLDHPGLDTSATRDGARLLIQNDIGTNDAHVLVLQVQQHRITLTYSDLHRRRFGFFRELLEETGARWSGMHSHTTPGLNAGEAYWTGTANFEADSEEALLRQLESIGARIVFLIDWNRARKRLQAFVDKDDAVAVLREAARREAGHMAWLVAGAERLAWNAMAAQGEAAFRLGDRLDAVLGREDACQWLVDVLVLAADAAKRHQSAAYVADEARLLLSRRLQGRRGGTALLLEHAGWCHALAQGLRDGLAHGIERDAAALSLATSWRRRWSWPPTTCSGWATRCAHRPCATWEPLHEHQEAHLDRRRRRPVPDSLRSGAFRTTAVARSHRFQGAQPGAHGPARFAGTADLRARHLLVQPRRGAGPGAVARRIAGAGGGHRAALRRRTPAPVAVGAL